MIYGVGIVDLAYTKTKTVNGQQTRCPFYKLWYSMLERCYSPYKLKRNPNYVGVTVCEEWLTFSNFKAWMETQDWEGNQLDKDLLCFDGAKIYSPSTCCFIPQWLNCGIIVQRANGNELFGVHIGTVEGLVNIYKAQCGPRVKKESYLGTFPTAELAHRAWQVAHKERLIGLRTRYSGEKRVDTRVIDALSSMVDSVEYEITHNLITDPRKELQRRK